MDDFDPATIPEEQAIDQRIVPFQGDELLAARTSLGDVYISLRGICQALGLNAHGQTQRIQRTAALAKALRQIPLETRGGRQKVYCLRVDKVGLWLAGVETDKLKGPFAAKIAAYHEDLAPEATRVFLRSIGASLAPAVPPSDPRLVELAEQIDLLTGTLGFLREHWGDLTAAAGQIASAAARLDEAVRLLESLSQERQTLGARQAQVETQLARIEERTQALTPAHRRQVQTFVDQMVRATKALPEPLTYPRIYGRLKTRFAVGSYYEVPDDAFENVMTFLRDMLRQATRGDLPAQGQLL